MWDDERLGQVISGSNKSYDAKWYPSKGEVYVKVSGSWTRVRGEKARNSREALNMADAYARNL